MPPLPKAKCPVCHAVVALRVGHQLREHRDARFDGLGKCPGAGLTIAEAEELVAGRKEGR
jgi:hypothetical protein